MSTHVVARDYTRVQNEITSVVLNTWSSCSFRTLVSPTVTSVPLLLTVSKNSSPFPGMPSGSRSATSATTSTSSSAGSWLYSQRRLTRRDSRLLMVTESAFVMSDDQSWVSARLTLAVQSFWNVVLSPSLSKYKEVKRMPGKRSSFSGSGVSSSRSVQDRP